MADTIKTNKPDRPVNGASIARSSVSGRKTQFIQQSTTGESTLTLASNFSGAITINLLLWPENMPSPARNANNLVSFANSIAWVYGDIYIDNDNDPNYLYPTGASLSGEQVSFVLTQRDAMTPDTYSGSTRYSASAKLEIWNQGASSHTYYHHNTFKYIMTGDSTL